VIHILFTISLFHCFFLIGLNLKLRELPLVGTKSGQKETVLTARRTLWFTWEWRGRPGCSAGPTSPSFPTCPFKTERWVTSLMFRYQLCTAMSCKMLVLPTGRLFGRITQKRPNKKWSGRTNLLLRFGRLCTERAERRPNFWSLFFLPKCLQKSENQCGAGFFPQPQNFSVGLARKFSQELATLKDICSITAKNERNLGGTELYLSSLANWYFIRYLNRSLDIRSLHRVLIPPP
jgi:hypothetical protein